MNALEDFKKKLRSYTKEQIIFTKHARIRAVQRSIELEEIKNNIINPDRLFYAEKQEAKGRYEEKYDCYFYYSKTLCHRYVLIINKKIIVCTVIKINRRWQRRVEKHEKI